MTTSVLDKTMRKIGKAFDEYQRLAASGLEPSGREGFVSQVHEIVRQSLLDGAEMGLRQTLADIRESLADLKDLRDPVNDLRQRFKVVK